MVIDASKNELAAITAAVIDALAAGEVVVIPTDTVYGLACDPFSQTAVDRLFALKQRPEGVPIAVLVGSLGQARELVDTNQRFESLAEQHWPGGLTLIADMRRDVAARSPKIGLNNTLGVRWSSHVLLTAIASAFGPVAATSANLHGAPTIVDPADAVAVFGTDVATIVDGGILENEASTVVDTTTHPVRVLRQGEVRVD